MVYTLGESLLDIIFDGPKNIVAKSGGGMLNTSVSLGRSGIEVSLISELGDDETAKFILGFLKENHVHINHIKKYYHQNTSVALAYLDEQKVPSFSIYKSYPENRRLISPNAFNEGDILIYGSLYSIDPIIRNEVLEIISHAKNEGALLCYDPNIRRHNLDKPELRKALNENFAFADVIKGSDEDFRNIFGENQVDYYREEIRKINPDALFVLTLGKQGVIGYYADQKNILPADQVKVISTIGAGDAFNAGMAYYLVKYGNDKTKDDFLINLLQSGLKFSAEVCSTMDNYVSGKL